MGFKLRNILMGFLLSVMLLPVIAFANSEYKGTETVNINRADAATLAAYLKGIGVNKAEAIVKYRKSNGKFNKVEDLIDVPGIGEETVKDNKRKMSTTRGKTVAPEGYKLGKSSGKAKKSSKKASSKKTSKKSSSKSVSTAKKTSSKTSDSKKKKSTKSSDSKKKSSKSSKDEKKSKKKKSTKKDKKSKDKKKKKKKSKKKDK